VLPANVRLDWKEIARYKHSSLFDLIISNEGKKFYNIDTRKAELYILHLYRNESRGQCYKDFYGRNKLECLSLTSLSSLV